MTHYGYNAMGMFKGADCAAKVHALCAIVWQEVKRLSCQTGGPPW